MRLSGAYLFRQVFAAFFVSALCQHFLTGRTVGLRFRAMVLEMKKETSKKNKRWNHRGGHP